MKMLRGLFAIVLVCGLANVAKASNFQMVVVDPTVPIDVIQPVTSDNFALTFPTTPPAAGCSAPGQLPSGVSDPADYTACFTGINLTGKPLTSLEIELPESVVGSSASCPTLTSGDEFSEVTCNAINGGADYLFDFTGGDIPTATIFNSFCYFDPFASGGGACSSPAIFTIAIGIPGEDLLTNGVASAINDAGVVAEADVRATPEPSSILLLSTGVLSIGFFGAYRRRQSLVVARPPTNLN